MLLSAFLKHFDSLPPERFRTLGASSAGRCARALAMAHHPDHFTPIPLTARRRARFMAGSAFEAICQGVIQKELPAHASGETAFLWPIPCDTDVIEAAIHKIGRRQLVGFVMNDMNPHDIPRWRDACAARGMTDELGRVRLGGIVVDEAKGIIYIPALPDGIADLSPMPEFAGARFALASQEFKTIATAGFRHVLRGVLDYGYRTQFAIEVDAAELDTHIAQFLRLETMHAVEIIYSRKVDTVRATFTLSNGSKRVMETMTEPDDAEWDEVMIEHPFQPSLLDQARRRIRRVLLSTAENLPAREYGPDFTCRKCKGYGELKCALCNEVGISKRSLKRKDGTPKPGIPCKKSKGLSTVPCPDCQDGLMDEVELGFPCGWCPFVMDCYPFARKILQKKPFTRPAILVKREDYVAAKITFVSPEAA